MDNAYYHVPRRGENGRSGYERRVFAPGTGKQHGWLTEDEYAATFPPSVPECSLEEARAVRIKLIDMETGDAILAGFDYEVNGQMLHFSYGSLDQQNFADTANASTLAKLGVPGAPESVAWSGWDIKRDEARSMVSRSPVRLVLDHDAFLKLYMTGALAHKAAQIEKGGRRKAAAQAAQSRKELEAV